MPVRKIASYVVAAEVAQVSQHRPRPVKFEARRGRAVGVVL